MKKYYLLIVLFVSMNILTAKAQTNKYPADIEEKINKVENNLSGWVQTGTDDTWNLNDRMKK